MRQALGTWLAVLCALVLLCGTVFADSKSESLKPLGDSPPVERGPVLPSAGEAELRKQLEAEYRAELEKRLAQERDSYAASLTSLWIANGAVWAVLLLFVIMQALSARKRMTELDNLKRDRER